MPATSPETELVDIVDGNNQIIAIVPRKQMRKEALLHRSCYVLVFDSKGALYVQKRTLTKDIFPGFWDPAAGGVVSAGETYERSAVRELEEEMGIRGVELTFHYDFLYESTVAKAWGRVFSCTWGGPIVPQAEEVQFVEKMTPEEIVHRSKTESFTPDGLMVIERWLRENS